MGLPDRLNIDALTNSTPQPSFVTRAGFPAYASTGFDYPFCFLQAPLLRSSE